MAHATSIRRVVVETGSLTSEFPAQNTLIDPPTPLSEEQTAARYAEQLKLTLLSLANVTIDPEAIEAVPEELARKHVCVPISLENRDSGSRPNVVLAMANPTDLEAIAEIEFATGGRVTALVATKTDIEDTISRCYAPDRWLNAFLKGVSEDCSLKVVEPGAATNSSQATDAPAVKLFTLLLQHGIQRSASDIHIEPSVSEIVVRYRVCGLLEEAAKFPKWLHGPLVSRIKVLAKMDIAERRRPQDGRIGVLSRGREVDVRVSTLPTQSGEKAVLRILGSGQPVPDLDDLGFVPDDLQLLRGAFEQPQGLILVAGPTGSGKTTTLYSVVLEKRRTSINIVTVEDPIEYRLPGLNQVQVNNKAGMTFAESLRSILRQDPDVILVGEIRDSETQEIAIRAAMTGHLVLSTIHTNGTLATITRLLELGANTHAINDSVSLIIAQRLMRRICADCAEPCNADEQLLAQLGVRARGHGYLQGRGCPNCHDTGYSGRLAVYEMLRLTPTIKELIAKQATEAELRKAAAAAGARSLLEQALAKAREGLTTLDEVARVISVESEEDKLRCASCEGEIQARFVVCPHCRAPLKHTCASCRQELAAEWKICPYCSATPRSFVEPTMFRSTPANSDNVGSRRRILIVDDEPVSRQMAIHALEKLPSCPEVLSAESGIEALEMVAASRPDLVVLDVVMPGLSGFDICRKLRGTVETAFIPVLMLTANSSDEHRVEGFLIGTDDYMMKPFAVAELHARVTRLLRRTYGA